MGGEGSVTSKVEEKAPVQWLTTETVKGEPRTIKPGLYMINFRGHYRVFYADELLSEDISLFDRCSTGRACMALLTEALHMDGDLKALIFQHDDLMRSSGRTRLPAPTRKESLTLPDGRVLSIVPPADATAPNGSPRMIQTATAWRRAQEDEQSRKGRRPPMEERVEPFADIAADARDGQCVLLAYGALLGVIQARELVYGEPSGYYSQARLTTSTSERQQLLWDVMQSALSSERFESQVSQVVSCEQLPFVENVFLYCAHLQDVHSEGKAILKVVSQLFMRPPGVLTKEALRRFGRSFNDDITARLDAAKAAMKVEQDQLVEAQQQLAQLGSQEAAELVAAAQVRLEAAKVQVDVADSRARGGSTHYPQSIADPSRSTSEGKAAGGNLARPPTAKHGASPLGPRFGANYIRRHTEYHGR